MKWPPWLLSLIVAVCVTSLTLFYLSSTAEYLHVPETRHAVLPRRPDAEPAVAGESAQVPAEVAPAVVSAPAAYMHASVLTLASVLRDVPPLKAGRSGEVSLRDVVHHLLRHDPQGLHAAISWRLLNVPLLLFGIDSTCKLYMQALRGVGEESSFMECLPFPCLERDVPRVDCIFQTLHQRSTSPMLMYTNADIILLPNLLEAAKRVSQLSGAYVVVGKRLDVEPTAMPAPHIVVEAVLAGRHQPLRLAALHPHDVLRQSWEQARTMAVNHDRNGIDYFLFSREWQPALPPFIVGRIEWDQWTLLSAIVSSNVTTVEASSVITALHVGHGQYKASHSRTGTDHNQQLARNLPHGHLPPNRIPVHRGTIWLGRLDETEMTLEADLGTPPKLRQQSQYFDSKAAIPAMASCPACRLQWNAQSLDLLAYEQHTPLAGHRTVAVVTVEQLDDMDSVTRFWCANQKAQESVIFMTADLRAWAAMRALRIPTYLLTNPHLSGATVWVQALHAVATLVATGYNVVFQRLEVVPLDGLGGFTQWFPLDDTDLALTTPKAEGAVPSEFDGTVMYVRSRARSFAFLQEVADAAKKINIDSAEAFRQLMAGHASAIASTADLSRRMIVRMVGPAVFGSSAIFRACDRGPFSADHRQQLLSSPAEQALLVDTNNNWQLACPRAIDEHRAAEHAHIYAVLCHKI